MTKSDIESYRVSDNYTSQHNGVTHIYLQQQFQGIDVEGAFINLNIWNNKVASINSRFVPNLKNKIRSTVPSISASDALKEAFKSLEIQTTPLITQTKSTENLNTFLAPEFAENEVPVKLTFSQTETGKIRLTWKVKVIPSSDLHDWNLLINAQSGQLLNKRDEAHHCSFGEKNPETQSVFSSSIEQPVAHHFPHKKNTGPVYHVYAHPVESPLHGSRTMVSDPSDPLASPFGWHDDDGMPGHEYTITRGNNVWAQENHDSDMTTMGNSPDGDSTMLFDFPIDAVQTPATVLDASTTNLFYWTNIMHDVFYHYGFDEVSGNFQANNYGKGGVDGDYILAFAQDNAVQGNAVFLSSADGGIGKLRMGVWDYFGSGSRDASLDNGIIAHEIGHGISARLVGGPSTTGCFTNTKSEGWSDFLGW